MADCESYLNVSHSSHLLYKSKRMMNPLISGASIPARSPPDKGSFPLDHFHECRPIHDKYLRCLKANKNDNMSCRETSKEYMQCRMDRNLMAKEEMDNLGFHQNDRQRAFDRKSVINEREAQRNSGTRKEDGGFTVVQETLLDEKKWRRPSMLGGVTWSITNPFKRS